LKNVPFVKISKVNVHYYDYYIVLRTNVGWDFEQAVKNITVEIKKQITLLVKDGSKIKIGDSTIQGLFGSFLPVNPYINPTTELLDINPELFGP
jgi:hypothetical protein